MGDSPNDTSCRFCEQRFQGSLYVGNDIVRTLSMQTPPRVGEEILFHERYNLPFERWVVKRITWQVTKDTDLTWFHAQVEKVDNRTWPPIEYP